MLVHSLLGILAGSFLWLDRVYIFQFMVSRPMIMGPILAVIMGDIKVGILIGASLELLWLNAPPVGSYLPYDESFCTAVSVPVAFFAGTNMDQMSVSGLSLLICLPTAFVGRSLDMRLRSLNEGLIPAGMQVKERDISRAMKKAIVRAFLFACISISICVAILGTIVHVINPFIPTAVLSVLSLMPFVFIIIGLAALMSKEMPSKKHAGVFILGLALVLFITWIL